MFIKIILTIIRTLCSEKKTNDLYVENDILQKLRDFVRNITRMLNILLTKFKGNIATYNLNEYKSYTKQSHLIF